MESGSCPVDPSRPRNRFGRIRLKSMINSTVSWNKGLTGLPYDTGRVSTWSKVSDDRRSHGCYRKWRYNIRNYNMDDMCMGGLRKEAKVEKRKGKADGRKSSGRIYTSFLKIVEYFPLFSLVC